MYKIKKKLYMIICILFVLFVISGLFLFNNVFGKLSGLLNNVSKEDYLKQNENNYPKINNVYNSSGEKITNSDVVLTISAKSLYNITKLEYSFDLNTWYTVNKKLNDKEINEKIIFSKTIDTKVYVRVENNLNLKSYPYETYINIDKEKPVISLNDNNIIVVDNNSIYKLQYFNDFSNFYEEEVNSKKIVNEKTNVYNYVRAVDEAGNISDILKLTK